MKSALRCLLPRRLRRLVAAGGYRAFVAADAVLHANGPLVPPRVLAATVGPGDFEAIGNEFLHHFRDYGGIEPHHRVLDVGCGIGRMAVPLTRFLSSAGSYEGFDVVPHGIAWCRRRISRRFPNFRFQWVPVRNADYNPGGRVTAAAFRFPYLDQSFDFVLLTSVFTHMTADGVENYVGEIARVLRPGGCCFSTWFLLNEASRASIAQSNAALDFRHPVGRCLTVNAEMPEQAIAFDEQDVRMMHERHRLVLDEPIRYGQWCGRPSFITFQDIVVARKT